jgi:biotin carboxylase
VNDLKGMKLLVLGGPALAKEIVVAARRLGVYVIVTDWYSPERSPAKKIADKALMISTADVDAIVQLVKSEKIDGVLTGFTDSTLKYYQQICEKAGLPCYLSAKHVEVGTSKVRFKEVCRQHGIPVVEDVGVGTLHLQTNLQNIPYPVLVKPVDNSGARGISICHNEAELRKGYTRALSFSESRSVIVEKYVQAQEATIFYLFDNGECYLTGVADRHMGAKQEGVVHLPVAYWFPSRFLESYRRNLDSKVRSMFKELGFKNGMAFIQAFVEDGTWFFYEMGYRLTGTLEYKILERVSGINPLEMMIRYALTGKMSDGELAERVNPEFSMPACNMTFSARPGEIGAIEGIEEVLRIPEVIDVFSSYEAGDIIPSSALGTLQQVVLRVFAAADTSSRLIEVMEAVQNEIDVVSPTRESMLLPGFDTNELVCGGDTLCLQKRF